ncbi:hypothetical protein [Sphingomonas sp. LM7]|uniref:hypothetical protein n=1 Tax=Sphingomonas sp. LM7 TaxID=1938607 RepID=UPI0015C575F9|nr:hypothetical protein [Sphingomonas sp. LM7]
MDLQNPLSLAAELRIRALCATAEERADLLFLAAEYERLAAALQHGPVQVLLPK